MQRLVRSVFLLAILALVVVPTHAATCDGDNNPAATLLLPYFEVDTVRPDGVNTLFSVSNAFATAQLIHVTFWSDLSVPIFDFNAYLTGFDMVTFDLRQIIQGGTLPSTASDGQDPVDTISPQGIFSQDINFASCTGQLPLPPLPAIFITHLKNSLTGQPSVILGGRCAGRNLGDSIARGYITIDTVNNCTLRFASDPGYFGPGGDATDDNALFGDFTVTARNGTAVTHELIAVEASSTDAATTTPGNYTFYGRYVGWNATDHREPLATTFGARYVAGRTELAVWRDSKTVNQVFNCGTTPAPYPLGLESAVYFDEQENPEVPLVSPVSPVPPRGGLRAFGAEAQRVAVDGPQLPVTPNSGWLYLNLNTTVAGNPNPPVDPAAAQAWVGILTKDANGRFLSGYDAVRYDSACQANHTNPGF